MRFSRLPLIASLAILLVSFSTYSPTQEKSKDPPLKATEAKVYLKGRVAPKNLAALKELDKLHNSDAIKKLPKATAASYDCRTLGIVPPIVDQKSCGSCWDFSGTSICTSAFIKQGWGKNDGSFMLSEQYTLDCGQNGGCNGDDNTTVTAWCKATGLPTTAQYGPYKGSAGRCSYNSSMTLYKISNWGFADGGQGNGVTDTQLIKNAMVAYGPIGAAIAADDAFMNNPPGTVFDRTTSTEIDHDIVLVGWDDTKGKNGAWILRNSWGTSWCDQGYCWIGYGVNAVGTEAIYAIAPPSSNPTPTPPNPNPPTPNPPAPGTVPVINSPLVGAASTISSYSYQITATNTPTVYGAVGLPIGLTVSTTGLISGTATTVGTYNVVLLAVNGSGVGTATLVLTVTSTPPLSPVQLTLTPDQVQTVITNSGVVTIRKEMTLTELSEALSKCTNPSGVQIPGTKTKVVEPPLADNSTPCDKNSARIDRLEKELSDHTKALNAILDSLGVPKK